MPSNPQRAFRLVSLRLDSDFPIHMLALPSARAYQYDRDRCIPNETITYALADRIHLSGVVYVTISDGTVYYIAVHHRCEN